MGNISTSIHPSLTAVNALELVPTRRDIGNVLAEVWGIVPAKLHEAIAVRAKNPIIDHGHSAANYKLLRGLRFLLARAALASSTILAIFSGMAVGGTRSPIF